MYGMNILRVVVIVDDSARTGRRGEGGVVNNKVQGACDMGRDALNDSLQRVLGRFSKQKFNLLSRLSSCGVL